MVELQAPLVGDVKMAISGARQHDSNLDHIYKVTTLNIHEHFGEEELTRGSCAVRRLCEGSVLLTCL